MQIIRHKFQTPNVGKAERASSFAAGALLLRQGLRSKGWIGTATALLGIAFLRRAVSGFSYSYQALGVNTAGARGAGSSTPDRSEEISVPHKSGVRIDQAVTINRPRAEVYRFWRDLGNIAEFLEHVESVRTVGNGTDRGNRSHWIAKGPGGKCVEWDAEIINEKENELIAWRSLEGSEIGNAGSVHFEDAAGGRGTEVRVEILYSPPGGAVGAMMAKLFASDPSAQVHADLGRLKARLEAGVLAGTEGQPVGPKDPLEAANGHATQHGDKVSVASEESFPASDSPAYTR
jgi:uncharacterized membrane protein